MKKLFLIATLALLSVGMSAQGLKGTWFAGGEFSYSDKNDIKTTRILPIAGTFVTPDVAIGAGIGYLNTKVDGVKNDSFVFKPLVRKYWNITGPIYLFGQAAAPLIFGDDTSVGLELSPGVDFVLTSWMTIETSFTIFAFNYTDKDAGGSDWNVGLKPFSSLDDRTVGQLQVGVKFLF